MQSVIDFIQTYWTYISAGILILIEVLILFLKRKPQTIDDFRFILRYVLTDIPYFINKVERNGEGDAKKSEVIKEALDYFKYSLRRDLSPAEADLAKSAISEQIEVILSTPQKKGAQNVAKKS